jgi:putative transposase
VLRYVERNALRAELVARAEDWKWSSLPGWLGGDWLLWRGVEARDERWLERVNQPLSIDDLQRLRLSVERGRPYGDGPSTKETARGLGLESTLRPRGRPRKADQLIMSAFFAGARSDRSHEPDSHSGDPFEDDVARPLSLLFTQDCVQCHPFRILERHNSSFHFDLPQPW